MPRLGVFSGQELRRVLEAHGFALVRQKGSHLILQKRTAESTVTVPIPDHAEIRIGTLQSIIRQSGIPKTVFLR